METTRNIMTDKSYKLVYQVNWTPTQNKPMKLQLEQRTVSCKCLF